MVNTPGVQPMGVLGIVSSTVVQTRTRGYGVETGAGVTGAGAV